jgi:hypothetical protein
LKVKVRQIGKREEKWLILQGRRKSVLKKIKDSQYENRCNGGMIAPVFSFQRLISR